MDIVKLGWAARGLLYKLSFGRFGNLSYIGKPVSIIGRRGIFIGDRVRIYPGARMEAADGGKIVIEDNTSIGQNFHVTARQEALVIGANTTINANVCVTNQNHDYRDIGRHILEQDRPVITTRIGENCFLGFGSVIQAGVILGKQCVVGANSVVCAGRYPDYCVLVGAPARVVKRYNPQTKVWEKVKSDD